VTESFFEKPILNSPYEYPARHWELDEARQPTNRIVEQRRSAEFISPIPKPRRTSRAAAQAEMVYDAEAEALAYAGQQYDLTRIIQSLRQQLDQWRALPNPAHWQVTPETQRLLQHWRHHEFQAIRPFFCQVEAAEAAIWLTEVAPKLGKRGRRFLDHLEAANGSANPGLPRLALKLATGAGKTTVMAMLIAWQTINAARRPGSARFTRGFLIVTPGITIKDRLRVLQPNDPDSYYASRELVPADMLQELNKARIVITNYHAFKRRETLELSKGGRALLQGRGPEIQTIESEGQMLQRVMPELLSMKTVMVLNDEAHHCYRGKPQNESEEGDLKGDDRKEAERNREAARLWISGIEAVERKIGLNRVFDLSATPFFISGSGYAEGTLFPWTMSDFSLMDAIECGIVKLPRVPVADNIPGGDMPKFRNLWEHIGKRMPKKGRSKGKPLDPQALPTELYDALDALYGHYEKTYDLWEEEAIDVPPCFIVVCNNTATSKLVADWIGGYMRENEDGTEQLVETRLHLFSNYDEHGNPYPRPRTLLIDSEQLESGDALDTNFRKMAADEIERFRSEIRQRGDHQKAENISESDLLREVMNTVGKKDRLGESVRCVVSVSMLTEGWDTNTVTHVLGVRAFGTQLLCEQVIGRALRRQSYDLNEEGRFNVEYADVLGIPFDFTAKPVPAPPQPPRETIHVKAITPERDACEIRFPRVEGYRVQLPDERLSADFSDDSTYELTPALVGGPSVTRNEGIIGAGVDLTLEHLADVRRSTILMRLTKHLLFTHYRDGDGAPKLHLFGQLKRITRQWLDDHLVCKGGAQPAQILYPELAAEACNRINAAIFDAGAAQGGAVIQVALDPYNPEGSTRHVSFNTSKRTRWRTRGDRCHVNWAITDSDWEAELCRVAESHPRVRSYVKNHNLGFEVPYLLGSEAKHYRPDFILRIDDGLPATEGDEDLLNLVVEVKGYRGEDAKAKKLTMETQWVPGVNRLGTYGRWAFAEYTDVYEIESRFAEFIDQAIATTSLDSGETGGE